MSILPQKQHTTHRQKHTYAHVHYLHVEISSWIWMSVSCIHEWTSAAGLDYCCFVLGKILYMRLHCTCLLCVCSKVCAYAWQTILWACLCGVSNSLCVCVCVCVCMQVEERGGSVQQGTGELNEGNGKEMTKALLSETRKTATLPLSSCMETWTRTHTYSLLLLWLWWKLWYTGSETQDGKHWTWRIERERGGKKTAIL